MSNELHLDAVDRDILFQLRRDGRLTNVELAKRVGLTPPPCLRRVKRLEEAGVIAGYRAVIDPEALGRGLEVLIDVEIYAQDRKSFEEFEDTVASYEEVVEFRRMYGRPDYFIRVAVADHAAYEAFLTGRLSGLPAVRRIESHLTMKEIKTHD
ncbi:Lrp/AsnC family transcriptional regulator [Streptomyces johnsoniae]|uniref:Lrp/AsnC family transcriptional regulator n=1 Tax=Streptomyces johnsoniae TaxID=3075532 RepID=A0ABU2SEC6_9ACTN|nr:Lrp/AsnC family transcriptional regulator [Streptomyces sp. DSM 41886]MDT0446204.1 Lrp/AsnC family transcriptional regulator [Streptomyces sp. DSM 41886]